jgi:peptidoglycan lytic transglycosylase
MTMTQVVRLLAAALWISAGTAHARPRTGVASWYGWHQNGRRMANGHWFHALGTSAASMTLPLGTRVKVTNLHNHRSAWVTIDDRGPAVRGRLIDLSLGTARCLGMEKQGLAHVRVSPVRVMRRDVRHWHVHHRRMRWRNPH